MESKPTEAVRPSWVERLVGARYGLARRRALSRRRPSDPEAYSRMLAGYLRTIDALEGPDARHYREATEIYNELMLVTKGILQGGVSVFDAADEETPRQRPRLKRETLEALGNEDLVKLRDREDRMNRWLTIGGNR